MKGRIYLISCKRDEARLERAMASIRAFNQTAIHIPALDARDGIEFFKPYKNFIGEHFWGESFIKMGAYACFLSHSFAWETLIKSKDDYALIMEDDALLTAPIHPPKTDIEFVNDRLLQWASYAECRSHALPDLINALLTHKFRPNALNLPRAPGGDGYLLTKPAAARLLKQFQSDKILAGVDWYLLYRAYDTKNATRKAFKNLPEFRKLYEAYGAHSAVLSGSFSNTPLVKQDFHFPSSINHKEKIALETLKKHLFLEKRNEE